jgi:putative aldouronate transport system substrate-binding protein
MSLKKTLSLCLVLALTAALLVPAAAMAQAADEPVLKVLYTKGGFEAPPADDPIKAKIEADTGIKFDFISPPSSNYTEQLHIILASQKDLPDIVAFNLKADVFDYASQGALLDLTPYLDLMPNITKLIPQSAMDYFKVDGKLYAIPKWTTTKRYNVVVRNDWLKKLNLQVPTTLDELHDVLTAFVNNDPDGNGVKDTYGISGLGMDGFEYIFGAFGVICGETSWNAPDTHVGIYFYKDGDKLLPMVTKPEMKQALELLNKWYAEGLIDPEFASQNNDTFNQKFEQSRYGMTTYWWNWEAQREAAMKTTNPDVEVIRIAPPIGPTGISGNRAVPEVVAGVSVLAGTKYPELCAKFMDYFHDENNGMMTSYTGVEGVHWEKTADGRFVTLPQFDLDNKWIQWYFLFENEQPLYKVETYLAPSRRGALEWNVIRDEGSGLMTQSQLKYNADLTAMVASTFTDFITGKKPLTEFDQFVTDFMNNGGQEWSDEITQLYNQKNAQ